MKKLFSSLFLLLCLSVMVKAVPAYPGLLTKTQPDGSTISYYLRGDENFNFAMSEDGYLITPNLNGVFEYAEFNDQKEIVSVGIKVSNVNDRTYKEKRYLKNALKVSDLELDFQQIAQVARSNKQQRVKSNVPVKRYPLKGEPTSLVILVNFADVSFQKSQADFTALLNEKGYSVNGGTGSARDFFEAASNGQFHPKFVVVGPYTLGRDMSYYGKDYGSGSNRNENYAGQMIVDACKAADDDVDFSEYDTDGDGYVDNVFVYYAGYNQAEGGSENSVWPHRSQIISKQNFDGVLLKDYACTSELKGSRGTTMCGIGTFCHEFGHVLGLPDFYVTDYGHNMPTLGEWDAMDGGPYNNGGKTPPSYSSYERFFLGWMTPTVLEPGGVFELKPLLESNTAFIVAKETHNLDGANPNPSEFFMIENRQRQGWDSVGLPGEGMLITHIDYSYSDWEYNVVNNDPDDMGVQIVCADGTTRDPSYNTFPGRSEVTTCFLTMKDGYQFPEPLSSIKQMENGSISFIYGIAPGVPYVSKDGIDFDQFVTDYGSKRIDTITFVGGSLSSNVEFRLLSGSNFKLRKLGEGNFGRGVIIEVAEDSTINCALEFLYEPRQVTEKGQYLTDKLTIKADNYEVYYDLKGVATKAIRISRPEALPATNITHTDFVANWKEQEYATRYYLSVYSISDQSASEVETFDVFTEDEIPEGWATNFYNTSKNYTASDPFSVYFKDSVDLLYTKEYFSDVDKISVWVHSYNTNGTFFIEGLIDGNWTNVLTEKITTQTRKKVLEVSLNGKKCRQFRMYYYKAVQSTGGLLIDDFTATVFNAPDFVVNARAVEKSGYKVTNLKNDKIYYYRVAASDKNPKLSDDPSEAISTFSNEIKVDLMGGVGVESVYGSVGTLAFEYLLDGSVCVDLGELPTADSKIYIYSVDGTLVEEIIPQGQKVLLENLVRNNIYVIKYSSLDGLNQTTKIGKLVY